MRNRAKCKLCKDLLESYHMQDHVECSCGEIAISGGTYRFYASAKDYQNFLRVDDEGNEISVKVVDVDAKEDPKEEAVSTDPLEMLGEYIAGIERLPKHLLETPISHADLFCALSLVHAALRRKS